MKLVRSSPLRTGRLYPQEYPGPESTPGHTELSNAPEKIPSDRSWDPPTSSAVP